MFDLCEFQVLCGVCCLCLSVCVEMYILFNCLAKVSHTDLRPIMASAKELIAGMRLFW